MHYVGAFVGVFYARLVTISGVRNVRPPQIG